MGQRDSAKNKTIVTRPKIKPTRKPKNIESLRPLRCSQAKLGRTKIKKAIAEIAIA